MRNASHSITMTVHLSIHYLQVDNLIHTIVIIEMMLSVKGSIPKCFEEPLGNALMLSNIMTLISLVISS